MKEVKIFVIEGRTTKPNFQTDFRKKVKATKPEDALEKIYQNLGSKHRLKRCHIKIDKIEESVAEDS